MTNEAVVSGGDNQNHTSGSSDQDQKKDVVSYESHLKLLNEKRKLKERLDELERASKEKEEADLRAKEDFKKIAELKEAEAKQFKEELEKARAREINAGKLDAFLSTLDGKVERKYWGHINLEQILVNPETGDLDQMSVAKEVERFRKEYPEVIKKPGVNQLSSAAPLGAEGGPITYEEWRKLPLKEQKARYKEMRESEKIRSI